MNRKPLTNYERGVMAFEDLIAGDFPDGKNGNWYLGEVPEDFWVGFRQRMRYALEEAQDEMQEM